MDFQGIEHRLENVLKVHGINFINDSIHKSLEEKKFEFPLILGIEKTGSFAEHAEIISKFLKPQTLMILTEDYIYKYILSSEKPGSGEYGSETYYGQKMYYRFERYLPQ